METRARIDNYPVFMFPRIPAKANDPRKIFIFSSKSTEFTFRKMLHVRHANSQALEIILVRNTGTLIREYRCRG